jgi:hypothetical protein
MRIITLLTLYFLTFNACKTVKYTTDNLPAKRLMFGEGGGFSGEVKEYILLENGQIFTRTSFTTISAELPKVPKKTAMKMFEQTEALKIKELEFIKPGNRYFYIQINSDSTTSHRVVWGSAKDTVPTAIESFYTDLKGLIKPPVESKK